MLQHMSHDTVTSTSIAVSFLSPLIQMGISTIPRAAIDVNASTGTCQANLHRISSAIWAANTDTDTLVIHEHRFLYLPSFRTRTFGSLVTLLWPFTDKIKKSIASRFFPTHSRE